MIRADKKEDYTEIQIKGNSDEILWEFLTIVSEVLKEFHSKGNADVVMEGLVAVTEHFTTAINNTIFNSKGEMKDD